jgi:hypothetical protein
VVGSIAASMLGMTIGFTAVLAISGMCYLVSLLSMTVVRGVPATREDVLEPV